MNRPIFVYGTLRPGNGNARLWHGKATATDDGECYVVGRALVTNGGFPYLVRSATGQTVGTLIWPYAADYDYVLGRMDQLEGYRPGSRHNHYERITVPVLHVLGLPIITAWTYVPADDRNVSGLPDVATNDGGFYDWACQPPRRSIINR